MWVECKVGYSVGVSEAHVNGNIPRDRGCWVQAGFVPAFELWLARVRLGGTLVYR